MTVRATGDGISYNCAYPAVPGYHHIGALAADRAAWETHLNTQTGDLLPGSVFTDGIGRRRYFTKAMNRVLIDTTTADGPAIELCPAT